MKKKTGVILYSTTIVFMNDHVLKLLRIVNGYKQREIANVLSIRQNAYSRLERNPKNITAGQAKKLAEFYKVSSEDLLSDKTPTIIFGKTANLNEHIDSLKEQRNFLRKQNEELMKLLAEEIHSTFKKIDTTKIR